MELCFVVVVDTLRDERLGLAMHSRLEYREENQPNGRVVTHFVRVFNELTTPRPFQVYRLADLDGLWHGGRYMAMRFRSPEHQVLVQTDDPAKVRRFLNALNSGIKKLAAKPALDRDYDPPMARYTSPTSFDRRDADFGSVSTLVLENCAVPRLTVGPSPVAYISLSNSVLGVEDAEQESFFDWMTTDAVIRSLEVLEMNNCKLDKLPFELVYLKKLNTLSVAFNKLKILPHFLGELKHLEHLFANNNLLKFLPGSLKRISFRSFNVLKNKFDPSGIKNQIRTIERAKAQKINNAVCPSLAHLSFCSLFSNDCVIKRQHLPHSMWFLFDELKRCTFCQRLVMSNTCFEVYDNEFAKTLNLSDNNPIPWQYFECKYKCSFNINYLDLNFSSPNLPTTSLGDTLRKLKARFDLSQNQKMRKN